MESVGTKGYTRRDLREMLAPLGLTDIRIETFATSYDSLPWKGFPFGLLNGGLGVLMALSGNRLGFWHGITARKA